MGAAWAERPSHAGAPPGFRHFLGDPARRFQWRGVDPRQDAAAQDQFRRDMAVLGRALEAAPEPAGKPRLAAGYTYALQLVAHDMVDTSLAFWATGPGSETRNRLTQPLRLHTLYGAEPGLLPLAYANDPNSGGMPLAFRLGRVRAAPGEAEPLPAGRDIPRISTEPTSDGTTARGLNATLLADARNDQHLLLSQTTVLFLALHNALLARLPPVGQADLATRSRLAEARFGCVRTAMVLIWREVLRADILPRILHPAVAALYAGGLPILEPEGPACGLPVEFSHGAFRFGHAMVRGAYHLRHAGEAPHPMGALLLRNSALIGNRFPQDATWVLDWSAFLPMNGGEALNMARPIGATSNPHFGLDPRLGHVRSDMDSKGLAFRDLLSAGMAGMWSVWALRDAIMGRPGFAPVLDVTPESWEAGLVEWWHRLPAAQRPSPGIMRGLADDPPLPFFVLLEAALSVDQPGLGALGSIIVAETILGSLARDRLPEEMAAGDLPGQLREAERLHGFAPGAARLPAIDSLPGILRFLSAEPQWQAAFPPLFSAAPAHTTTDRRD